MINIVIDKTEDRVEIEGKIFDKFDNCWNNNELETFIKYILDKAYYSGERLCLEIKDENGYTEVERWS